MELIKTKQDKPKRLSFRLSAKCRTMLDQICQEKEITLTSFLEQNIENWHKEIFEK